MGSKRDSGKPFTDFFCEAERDASFHLKIMPLERLASRYFGYLTLVIALALLLYAAVRIF
jgi:hypothetical protein